MALSEKLRRFPGVPLAACGQPLTLRGSLGNRKHAKSGRQSEYLLQAEKSKTLFSSGPPTNVEIGPPLTCSLKYGGAAADGAAAAHAPRWETGRLRTILSEPRQVMLFVRNALQLGMSESRAQ